MTSQLFAPGTFDNSPPTINLVNKGVKPYNGTKDQTYDYLIEYFDADSDLPRPSNGGYIQIEINDREYDMIETSTDDTDTSDGKYYSFTTDGTNLRPDNKFRILAHDGTYLVSTRTHLGPNVTFGLPPVAKAGKDVNVKAGELFWLDARDSSDPEGKIVKYLWDTDGDGDFNDTDGSKEGARVSFKFDEPGEYNITLLIIDEDGNSDIDKIKITVTEDEDDKDEPPPVEFWLYLGIVIIIIIVLLIVAMVLYRRKLQDDRDREAFMGAPIAEEEEEVEEEEAAEEEAEEPVEEEELDEEEEMEDIEEDEYPEDLDEEEDVELEDVELDEEELVDLDEDEVEEVKKPPKEIKKSKKSQKSKKMIPKKRQL